MAVIVPVMPAAAVSVPSTVTSLSATNAFTVARMTFSDQAPAPLTAMPAPPKPIPTAIEAAAETALIDASSDAPSATLPDRSSVTLEMDASIVFSIRLRASATPIETAAAVPPAIASATAAAPAVASIVDVSAASSEIPAGATVPPPVPSIEAQISVAIRFSVHTPDPARPNALAPAAAIATETEMTVASMSWSAAAVAESTPPAVIVEPVTYARTCDASPATVSPCSS